MNKKFLKQLFLKDSLKFDATFICGPEMQYGILKGLPSVLDILSWSFKEGVKKRSNTMSILLPSLRHNVFKTNNPNLSKVPGMSFIEWRKKNRRIS